MNLPFLISDIIERIVPGGIFLLVAMLLFGLGPIAFLAEKEILAAIAFFGFAYSFGVMFNVVGGKLPFLQARIVAPSDGRRNAELEVAFVECFGGALASDSWRYCYGVVHKEGLIVNTALFSGMAVFCRSMAICCLLICLAAILAPSGVRVDFSFFSMSAGSTVLLVSLLCSVIFSSGAQMYGRSFVDSIYDAFITYHSLASDRQRTQDESKVAVRRSRASKV